MTTPANSSRQAIAYRAKWVFPVSQPPIDGGVVTIAGGRIVSVASHANGPVHDLGDVALLPGFVNAHTHLEFSLLGQPLGHAGLSFADWIALVVEHRRQQAKVLRVETDGFQRFRRQAATAGLSELAAAATVAVGNIETPGWPRECYHSALVRSTIFLELLGLDPAQEDDLLAMGQSFVLDLQDTSGRTRPGLSPHAPYTVSPRLLEQVCRLSKAERCPVAMHLAESREELELLATQSGWLVEVLRSLGAWHPSAVHTQSRPLDYLNLLATAHRALVIHGNYLEADEIAFLAAHRDRMSVVYCPRTHTYFGHDPYPLSQMLEAGVAVAVGTDSRATNPDLNILNDLRHIARCHPTVSPDSILKMGTLSSAMALGAADRFGSLSPGKSVRMVTMPLPDSTTPPLDALFHSETACQPLLT